MLAKLPVDRRALLDAADLIETNGLSKKRFKQGGRYCVRGAIRQVLLGDALAYENAEAVEAEDRLTTFLVNKRGFIFNAWGSTDEEFVFPYCAEWNNEEERTEEEVVSALREAALYGL